MQNSKPKAVALFKRFTEKYNDIKDANEVPFPSYTGNIYDATHMIALVIKKANGTDGPKMQAALESLGSYDGLLKSYSNPFSPDRHEALGPNDYSMTVWKGSRLELTGWSGTHCMLARGVRTRRRGTRQRVLCVARGSVRLQT